MGDSFILFFLLRILPSWFLYFPIFYFYEKKQLLKTRNNIFKNCTLQRLLVEKEAWHNEPLWQKTCKSIRESYDYLCRFSSHHLVLLSVIFTLPWLNCNPLAFNWNSQLINYRTKTHILKLRKKNQHSRKDTTKSSKFPFNKSYSRKNKVRWTFLAERDGEKRD